MKHRERVSRLACRCPPGDDPRRVCAMADQISEQPPPVELYCPQCGYDLRAIESARCPECGLEIDRSKLGESIIPWLHREKLGRYRAFWRMVNLATFQPKKLAREMNCPAHFGDAVKFRRMVVLHAWLPLTAAVLICFMVAQDVNPWSDVWLATDRLGSALQLALAAFWIICLWFYLLAMTGLASYFFHPKALSVIRQNRAVALSYYACAPMAYTLLTLGLLAGAMFALANLTVHFLPLPFIGAILLIGYAPLIVQLIAILRTPVAVLRITTRCDWGRRVFLMLFLLIGAALLGFLLLILVPLAAGVIALLILSFRS